MKKKESISPRFLYPMTTIESIDPDVLKRVVCEMRSGSEFPAIKVIEFDNFYFIVDGDYEMLAANIIGISQVDIEIENGNMETFWLSESSIKEQLKSIGMNAIYDFEAIGGFKYSEYPVYYKGGC